jgi:flagellar protein FliS
LSTAQVNAARKYREQAILTASKEKIVVLLYDGALRYLDRARLHVDKGNRSAVGESLSKAFAVVSELRSSLDRGRGGEIAAKLDGLYVFVQDRITATNRTRDLQTLGEARDILATLKEGWDAIICR